MATTPIPYLSLFAGAAGLDLAVRIAAPSSRCIGYVENEIGAARILAARMEDGSLESAPIWSDVRRFPCGLYRGRVAGILAGFPCPDYSVAGKRAGIVGKHGRLWEATRAVVDGVRPDWLFLENVPGILVPHRAARWRWDRDRRQWSQYLIPAGLWFVLGDLAQMGFDAEWGCVRASDVGAPHKRERWLAYRPGRGCRELWQPSGRDGFIGGAARQWPTPQQQCARHATMSPAQENRHTPDIASMAAVWKTPHGMGNVDANGKHGGAGGGEFAKQVNQWPTPDASPERGTVDRYTENNTRTGRMLKQEALLWNTPKAITGGPESAEEKQAHGRTESGGATFNRKSTSGRLQPPTASEAGGGIESTRWDSTSRPESSGRLPTAGTGEANRGGRG